MIHDLSAFPPGTGLAGLDAVIRGLRAGDNVVWQVESVETTTRRSSPRSSAPRCAAGRRVVYHRFARHPALVAPGQASRCTPSIPSVGFESFTAAIHASVERAGRGACHVFDCLSDLAADWCSDLMLGNFFRVTCPYLFELDTITYFAVLRDGHSLEAVQAIRSTTQLLVDVFRQRAHALRPPAQGRGAPLAHHVPPARVGGRRFRPLTESAVLAEALADAYGGEARPRRAPRRLGQALPRGARDPGGGARRLAALERRARRRSARSSG